MNIELEGYTDVRKLPTGELAGLQRMLFTVGLFVGIDEIGYRTRFCFPTYDAARLSLEAWDGVADPSGPWIKEKPVDRSNPNIGGVPVVAA